ncbi:MAG TPA: sensor histidine kinase [Usitatibacter sp.]|nr:sensor histidine kinase [Usitatibacter sp.]
MRSLRQHLLLWLLPPLVTVGAVATTGAYFFMELRLTDAYDLDLGDIARTIVPYVHLADGKPILTFDRQADAVLRADSTDQVYYSVLDSDGKLIAGERELPHPPISPGPEVKFWDDVHLGQSIRAVTLTANIEGQPIQIVAAETTRKRDIARREVLLSAAIPTTLLSIAAIFAVVLGVRGGLAPVERLRREVQSRSHKDLRPVEEAGTADELRPLVHELNEMLARLGAAQETQTRFIANAAHQLRTPIAGLVTQLDLVKSGDPAQRDAHLARAREGAARLARLAQQVLSLARADPVSNPAVPEQRCDLAEIVKDNADVWLRRVDSRNVELEFELAPASIQGNAVLVGEMASNLVDNAARYGAKTVRVVTRNGEGNSVLEVIDDGPGIPPAERERIFERFRRLDNENTEGSGLGLAIVNEIAQRHRARIAVNDGDGGAGTRFSIVFPAVTMAA